MGVLVNAFWFLVGAGGMFALRWAIDNRPRKFAKDDDTLTLDQIQKADKVWFPQGGEWHLGHVHSHLDAAMLYWKVYDPARVESFKVAACDVRRYRGEPLHDPAPALSTAEWEDERK